MLRSTWTAVALVAAVVLVGCHGPRTTARETSWLRVEEERPREVLPHMIGVGDKQMRISVRRDGAWKPVGTYPVVVDVLEYGGRHALIRVIAHDGRRFVVGLDASGARAELEDCAALAVDRDGTSASCVRCIDDCERVEIITYRDPRVPPVRRKLDVPADTCDGAATSVEWYRDPEVDATAPILRITCEAPAACVYLRVHPDSLVRWGRRDQACP